MIFCEQCGYPVRLMNQGDMDEMNAVDAPYIAPDESTWISKQAYEEHTGRKVQETQ